jgi:anti-sigma factor RsiW
MEFPNLGRPHNKHLDERELDALAQSSPRTGLSSSAIRDAEEHVRSCAECRTKLARYREVLQHLSGLAVLRFATLDDDATVCPNADEVDWNEVASGLWPQFKAQQLIEHAATCSHCGPLLRAATNVDDDPTPQEEEFLASLKPPVPPRVRLLRPRSIPRVRPNPWSRLREWRVALPAITAMLLVGIFIGSNIFSSQQLSGSKFAEFAVATHRQHAEGHLALDVHADSQQVLNEWLKANAPFPVALPESLPESAEKPFRLNGARLVRVRAHAAAFIAYQMDSGAVSLMVAPNSLAAASGGTEVPFKKVSFHYRTVDGYKVVTWTAKGLTYALVSQEGNRSQKSCMVCHSAMRDRDLTNTPAPLPDTRSAVSHLWE